MISRTVKVTDSDEGERITHIHGASGSSNERRLPLQSVSLLDTLEDAHARSAADLLASCPTLSLSAGAVHRHSDMGDEALLLLLEEGFVVVRSVPPPPSRSMITCEAAYGGIVLPPAPEELLEAVLASRLTVLSGRVIARLLELPGVANAVLQEVAETLRRKQDSISNFGNVRHTERVRRKLLQLAQDYGKVTGDGVKLELPLTHALLGGMVGSERETVTRAIDRLEVSGFLTREDHSYRLHVSPEAFAG